jgi:hypothetical protein
MERALKEHAYTMTILTQAWITIEGMKAHNSQNPHLTPYSKEDFDKVIEDLGIHHNAVLSQWEGI